MRCFTRVLIFLVFLIPTCWYPKRDYFFSTLHYAFGKNASLLHFGNVCEQKREKNATDSRFYLTHSVIWDLRLKGSVVESALESADYSSNS